jgi:hypothetical protein
MSTQVAFHYWTEWCDEKGALYAQPHYFDSPTDARKAHKLSLQFMWVKNGFQRASVTDLYSVVFTVNDQGRKAETQRSMIADGGVQVAREATLS